MAEPDFLVTATTNDENQLEPTELRVDFQINPVKIEVFYAHE